MREGRSVQLLLKGLDASTPANSSPAANIFAAARHPEMLIERTALQVMLKDLMYLPGDERNQLNSGGLDHRGWSFRDCPADDQCHLLGPQKMQQFQEAFRIKGDPKGAGQGFAVDLGDQQGSRRIKYR